MHGLIVYSWHNIASWEVWKNFNLQRLVGWISGVIILHKSLSCIHFNITYIKTANGLCIYHGDTNERQGSELHMAKKEEGQENSS